MLLSIEKSRSETCAEKHDILHAAADKILEFRMVCVRVPVRIAILFLLTKLTYNRD